MKERETASRARQRGAGTEAAAGAGTASESSPRQHQGRLRRSSHMAALEEGRDTDLGDKAAFADTGPRNLLARSLPPSTCWEPRRGWGGGGIGEERGFRHEARREGGCGGM